MPGGLVAWESTYDVGGVSGPDGANRLLLCTGMGALGQTGMSLEPNEDATTTWIWRVGPELTHREFHRAMATVSVSQHSVYFRDAPTVNSRHHFAFRNVDADWDDEAKRAQLRVEVEMGTGPGVVQVLNSVLYTVTILAEEPPA
jgi:hypothetical protein